MPRWGSSESVTNNELYIIAVTLYTYPENWRAFKAQIAAQYSGARLKDELSIVSSLLRWPAAPPPSPLDRRTVPPPSSTTSPWARFQLFRAMTASVFSRVMPLLTTVSLRFTSHLFQGFVPNGTQSSTYNSALSLTGGHRVVHNIGNMVSLWTQALLHFMWTESV
ncbi:unnamed protein product [Oncorhynchus mykiss]|uniref:Uncharacterized protein n=1 Tax=Oncorhynchus mykiss TaxID=8022 RepID=A0A060YM78_ONCMY|nr:unnamed protein product [Oncorhynchus mykiss]